MLVLRSPFLEEVSMDGPGNSEALEILKDRHSWLEELVTSVGVKFPPFTMSTDLDLSYLYLGSGVLNVPYLGSDSDDSD